MRESQFVEQNSEKWAAFEKALGSRKKDPETLRKSLIEVTDDLSYAQTYYKNRSVRVYLNGLAQKVYNLIYKNRRNLLGSIKTFFIDDVPRIMYHARKELLVAFIVLLVSIGIGVFSSMRDNNFAVAILGADYVSETIANIESGNPMGVYKDEAQVSMFYRIAVNNLTVSLYVFLFGLFASYGALVLMVRNGVMLGVFIHFFYARHLETDFNYTVWMHGTIEVLTLVVETVAGMLLGRGLIYPGTYSRSKAFAIWGRRGAMVFLSTIPFIITAAFIESFLTRHTELPNIVRGLLIVLSLALMVLYFVWLPFKRFRNSSDWDNDMPELKPETSVDFKPHTIYSSGAIFLKSIQLMGIAFSKVIRNTVIITFCYIGLLYLISGDMLIARFKVLQPDFTDVMVKILTLKFSLFSQMFNNLSLLFNPDQSIGLYVMTSLWLTGIAYTGLSVFSRHLNIANIGHWRLLLNSFLFATCINSLLFFDNGFVLLSYILFSVPMLVLLINVVFNIRKGNIFSVIAAYWGNGISRMTGMVLMQLLMVFFAMIFLIAPVYYFLVYVVDINIPMGQEAYHIYVTFSGLFSLGFLITLTSVFVVIQSAFLTYTIKEIADAEGLRARIEDIGNTKKAYGFETE